MGTDIVYAKTEDGREAGGYRCDEPSVCCERDGRGTRGDGRAIHSRSGTAASDSSGAAGGAAKLDAGTGSYGGCRYIFGRDEYVSVEVGSGKLGGGC